MKSTEIEARKAGDASVLYRIAPSVENGEIHPAEIAGIAGLESISAGMKLALFRQRDKL
jgi:hypothetical protein